MRESAFDLPAGSPALAIATAVAERGGRVLIVGGWVRDQLLGRRSADLDLEVYGLEATEFEALLARFGRPRQVGRAFGVWLIDSLPLQISAPEPSESGEPLAEAFARAAARRDLRINSMGFDPLSRELLDPHAGREDLRRGVLQATDSARFGEDPLRVLRVARFTAVFRLLPTPELKGLCREIDLEGVASERVFEELGRLLLEAERPSLGFEFMREVGALARFPELGNGIGVPQDERWHPEGCVWTHTMMVVDEAARLRRGEAESDLRAMWAALCHDMGKADTTRREGERVVAAGHEATGAKMTRDLLARLRAPEALAVAVAALVAHHLAPVQLVKQAAGGRGYRKLARALALANVSAEELERLARADQWGRTTADGLARRFDAGDAFLAQMERYALSPGPADRDVVQGRHVLALGIEEGPEVGRILASCREVQDETGSTDPSTILQRVLGPSREGHQ